jgi:hypothetical protein
MSPELGGIGSRESARAVAERLRRRNLAVERPDQDEARHRSGASMKLSLLISTAGAIVIAAAAMSSAAAGSSGARIVPGFRSPSENIHCHYDPKAFAPPNGTKRLLTCGLRHADYAMQLQRRCPAGDWHGFGLRANTKPTIFCAGNPDFSIRPVYTTLAYGKSWTRGPFTCTTRITGVSRNQRGHGLFISRQAYRTW